MNRGKADLDGYLQVEGFFGPLDAEFYVHQVSRAGAQATFVEIGSWKGRSSYCMAEAIRDSGKGIEFWCVDTWQGSEELQDFEAVQEGRLFDEFMANVAPVRNYLKPLQMSSLEASEQFDDESLDLVFIDASHDYDNVLADIEAWRGKVNRTGVLAGHDYSRSRLGVVRAVETAFGGGARSFGACWYYAPHAIAPAPWSIRALRRGVSWRIRRVTSPDLFRQPGASAT